MFMKEDDIHILSQPLLTEEGFVNPACMQELETALLNTPPIHERTAGDPEWNTPRITYYREITGYVAHWAVRQIEEGDKTPFPPGLEKVIGYLTACIRPKFDETGWAELSLCDIGQMLHDILMEDKTFLSWNDANVLKGWLDLDAFIGNVCCSIRNERRAFDEFNREFEEEQAARKKT
jgi:hypothetical protein